MKLENNDAYLCDSCKKVGYCLQRAIRNSVQIKQPYIALPISPFIIDNSPISDREIVHWVPIRTNVKDANTKFGKKLQQAHELFHQDEFEQASYMYQDMLETRNDCDEIKIGLAASFYFLKKYEEAFLIVTKLADYFHKSIPNRLANECEEKLKELDIRKEKSNLISLNRISILEKMK